MYVVASYILLLNTEQVATRLLNNCTLVQPVRVRGDLLHPLTEHRAGSHQVTLRLNACTACSSLWSPPTSSWSPPTSSFKAVDFPKYTCFFFRIIPLRALSNFKWLTSASIQLQQVQNRYIFQENITEQLISYKSFLECTHSIETIY